MYLLPPLSGWCFDPPLPPHAPLLLQALVLATTHTGSAISTVRAGVVAGEEAASSAARQEGEEVEVEALAVHKTLAQRLLESGCVACVCVYMFAGCGVARLCACGVQLQSCP